MKIIRPYEIGPPEVGYTNVVVLQPAWSASADYLAGDLVSHIDRLVYQAVQASGPSTVGPFVPGTDTDGDGLVDTYYWIEYSATNPWQPFYGSVGNAAIGVDGMQYVLYPGKETTGIALFEVSGFSVSIIIKSASSNVEWYNEDYSLISTGNVYDWYSYFFEELESASTIVDFNLPAGLIDPVITITVTADVEARIGEIVVGETIDLGWTQRNPSIGIVDYSGKETDSFGNIDVVERPYSQKANLNILVTTDNINYISRILTLIRSQPVVWGVLDDVNFVSTVLIYGYLKDYNMAVPNPLWSSLNIQIEGLT